MIERTNTAYLQVPAFATTLNVGVGAVTEERTTYLENGIVTTIQASTGKPGDKHILTVADAGGMSMTFEGRSCWNAGGPTNGLGIGEPPIPSRYVTSRKAWRSDEHWRLEITRTSPGNKVFDEFETTSTYLIDADTYLIRSVRHQNGDSAPEILRDTRTIETHRALDEIPPKMAVSPVCPPKR